MVSLEVCGQNLTKLYECNRKRCGIRCSYPMCKHTLDIEFAERPNDDDFDLADGYLVQRIAPPSDAPSRSVMGTVRVTFSNSEPDFK